LVVELDHNKPYILQKIFGEPKRLLQVLNNFLSFSIKHTKAFGIVKVSFKIVDEQESNPMVSKRNNNRKIS